MILHFCIACLCCCAICCRHSGFRAVVCLAPSWPPSSLPPWGKKATASGDSGHERPDDRTDGRTDEGGGEYEKGGKMRRNRAAREEGGVGDVTTVVHPSDGVIVCMCTYAMRAHRIRKAVQLLSGAQGPQPTSATKYRDRKKMCGCLLSYDQAEPGRELTQPSPRL